MEDASREYSMSSYPNTPDVQFACEMHFEAGAEWMHEQMTRWHNPEVDVPEDGQRILLKATNGQTERIYLGSMCEGLWVADGGFVFTDDAQRVLGFDGVVIGWREIHE